MAPPPYQLGITMGDPAGIGPEVIVKALLRLKKEDNPHWIPVVIGAPDMLQQQATAQNAPENFFTLLKDQTIPELPPPGVAWLLPIAMADKNENPAIGHISAAAGDIAYRAIETAIRLCLAGELHGICTAPIHKAAQHLAGHLFPGHTEILKSMCNAPAVAMCLVGGGLRAVPLTTHIPLRQVPSRISCQAIIELLTLLHRELPLFGVDKPRIAVTGLNPHAGDQGILGSEEETIIRPAIEHARNNNIAVSGPVSADVVYQQMLEGRYDCVLAMYHDQALIPIKTLDFHRGVNVTLGLPFIRTSPDHGAALDIAGKNQARPDSMIQAIRQALQLIDNKVKTQ